MKTTEVLGVKAAVRERDGNRCTQCGMPDGVHGRLMGKGLEVHRIEPGGAYTLDGCVTLCHECHMRQPRSPKRKVATIKISAESYQNLRIIRGFSYPGHASLERILADIIAVEAMRVRCRHRILTEWEEKMEGRS